MKRFVLKNKKVLITIIIISIVGLILFTGNFNTSDQYVPYSEFIVEVEKQTIERVELQEKKVYFIKQDDETQYYTENPETNDFKEYLLLRNIVIENSFGEEELLNIMDWLFYGIFFGAVAFGVYKIISITQRNFRVIHNNKTKFSDIAGMDELRKT